MSRYTPTVVKKRRSRALRPVIGLAFAVLLGTIAYIAAPAAVDFAREQNAEVATQFAQFEAEFGEMALRVLTAVLLWALMLAIAFFIVAALTGRDPEAANFRELPPSPADRKAHTKALERELKAIEKQRKKARK